MHYEEQTIDGVLCWRGTPTGEWVPFTAKELTEMLANAVASFEQYREGWTVDARRMELIATIAGQQGLPWDKTVATLAPAPDAAP